MKFLMEPWSLKNGLKHTNMSKAKFLVGRTDNVLEN